MRDDEVIGGKIVNEAGQVLASHQGIHQFTIGQRRRLGVPSMEPQYVLEIEEDGRVLIGSDKSLYKTTFDVRTPIWVGEPPKAGEVLEAQIRSRFSASPAVIDRIDGTSVRARFETPQRAITPGQAAVFYRGEEVLGGGWISRAPSQEQTITS
jgi:tRNA-specific 2-thiouridylase